MPYLLIALTVLLILVAAIILLYLRDHRARVDKARTGGLIAQTACGPIEYAISGEGLPVIALHGNGGGWDQGSILGRLLHGFRVIAPSRPGYLGTPLEAGHTHAEQAEAMIALLDALDIDQVAVIAASAGGPIGLQMALHHPDRIKALVMVSALSHSFELPAPYLRLAPFMLSADFIAWAGTRIGIKQTIRGNVPNFSEVEHDSAKMALLQELLEFACTGSQRAAGSLNDLTSSGKDSFNYNLGDITVPTLVVHGKADPIATFSHGENTAQHIPGAQFMPIEQGGHLCIVTHQEQIIPAVEGFIRDQFA